MYQTAGQVAKEKIGGNKEINLSTKQTLKLEFGRFLMKDFGSVGTN